MKTKVQIKSIFGNLLFEFECETLKEAVVEAVNNRANLSGANLSGADLSWADLRRANLYRANLREANLREANLREADLRRANLRGANLRGADLYGAENSEMAQALTTIAPEGDIIGWKKCRDNIIVKLLIPKKAKRSNATGRKCRAEYVEVLELIDMKEKRKSPKEAISQHDEKTTYRKGETVKCDKWNENRFEECAGGIHFFITRLEAEEY